MIPSKQGLTSQRDIIEKDRESMRVMLLYKNKNIILFYLKMTGISMKVGRKTLGLKDFFFLTEGLIL